MAADSAWEIVAVPGAGRGLRATRALAAGDAVLAAPCASWWPCADAAWERLGPPASQVEREDLSEEAVVALWLLRELRGGGEASDALAALALPEDVETCLQWSEGDLAALEGTCFHQVASGLREETSLEWEALTGDPAWTAVLAGEGPERFAWAKATVISRQLELECPGHLPEGAKVVVPVFDLMNHDASGAPSCEFEVEELDSGAPQVVVRCARDLACGEELRISYGALPNASLLIFHGFAVEENPFDCVEFVLSFALSPGRRRWLRALAEHDSAQTRVAGATCAFDLVIDPGDDAPPAAEFTTRHVLTAAAPLPPTLLAAVRLQMLPEAEVRDVAGLCAAPGVDAATDRTAALLRGFLDGHRVAAPAAEAASPDRAARARLVRDSEVRILEAALDALAATS